MKKGVKKRLLFVLSGSLMAGLFFLTGFYFGKGRTQCEVCAPEEVNFSLFWETYRRMKKKYVSPSEIDEKEVLYGAISGMTEAVGDPYTAFLEPEDAHRFKEDISGEFEGVGMEIGIREGVLQVIAPLEGTPADKAGLEAGDKVLEVDGDPTSKFSLEELVRKIRGPRGSVVRLTVKRERWEDPRQFEIKRARIEVPSLRWELLNRKGEKDEKGNIAYLKVYHFTQRVGVDFARAASRIKRSPAEKIVLDLRNNPGGYLEMAREIAGYFLERGKVVVIEDSGEEKREIRSQGPSLFANYPLTVLINRGSASASEITAGALRANREVKLVGEHSFGKGSVQELVPLSGGSSLKVTVAKWLTPEGKTIEEEGLEPDVAVEMEKEDLERDRDPQLKKALEIITWN